MSVKRFLPVVSLVLIALLLGSAAASADDLGVLDAKPDSPGNVAIDGAGNAYITWTSDNGSDPDNVVFCKVPAGGSGCSSKQNLPLPPATGENPEPSGAFPVIGPDGFYVVAPRYVQNDVAIWKSTDGGASFAVPVTESAGYTNLSDPDDAFYAAGEIMIGAHNPGLGFSTASGAGGGGSNVKFERDLGPGGVAGSSLGVDGTTPVTVYWNISSPPYPLLFLAYDGTGPMSEESNWVGPTKITDGYEPRLAGGPSGLFLASEDYPPGGGSYPTVLDVRKYGGGSFGPPITLANDPEIGLFNGGSIDQSAAGSQVAVVWPGERAGDKERVMRLYLSGNGGAGFGGEVDVAHVGTAYAIGDNAEAAVGDGGNGWVTFIDAAGLHLANFAPIAGPAPAAKPPNYKGKSKVADKKTVGGYSLFLRLPKQCVQSQQRFFAGVGAKKRKALAKKLGGKVKLKQVVFVYDGKKLKVKKKKPFRYLIDPGAMPAKSIHVVKAKVTAILTRKGTSKKVKRTLKGTIAAC